MSATKPKPPVRYLPGRARDAARCDHCGVLVRGGERLTVREVTAVLDGHGRTRVLLHCEACA